MCTSENRKMLHCCVIYCMASTNTNMVMIQKKIEKHNGVIYTYYMYKRNRVFDMGHLYGWEISFRVASNE